MTLDEFEIALDDWGADIDLWPLDQQQPVNDLLQSSAAARAMLADAQRLEAELDGLLGSTIAAPAGLADRIFAVATNPPYSAEIVRFPVSPAVSAPAPSVAGRAAWWPPRRSFVVAAAAMVVCFLSGVLTVQTVFPEASTSEADYASSLHSLDW